MAVLTVTNTLDDGYTENPGTGSLRAAIAAANPGDIIKFDASLANETIVLKRRLKIDKDITLDATDAPGLTLDGTQQTILFQLDSAGTEFTIRGLTLANAYHEYNGAAIRGRASDLKITVEDSKFINNIGGMGAAIYAKENADVTVLDSQFTGNQSNQANDTAAGAISVFNKSKLTVKGSEFVNNQGVSGGAIGTIFTELTVEDSVFENNRSDRWSGAVHADGVTIPEKEMYYKGDRPPESEGGNIIIRNSQFENNQSGGRGGAVGIWGYDQDYVLLEGNSFIGNKVTRRDSGQDAKGGALRVSGKEVTIKDSRFEGNTSADEGGALWYQGESEMLITNTLFSGNKARKGGAIHSQQWNGPGATIEDSTFENNRAFEGGAIYRNKPIPMTITGSLFENNGSDEIGGALQNLVQEPGGTGATLTDAPEIAPVVSAPTPQPSEPTPEQLPAIPETELPSEPEVVVNAKVMDNGMIDLLNVDLNGDGTIDPTVSITVIDINSDASYNNAAGYYEVLDTAGTVIDPLTNQPLRPGELGYEIAALSQRVPELEFDPSDRQFTATVEADRLLAPYLISNGTIEDFLAQNPVNDINDTGLYAYFAVGSANPDEQAHIRALETGFGFEDLYQGGDQDFNDLTFAVEVTA